jgi:hypothetical protein
MKLNIILIAFFVLISLNEKIKCQFLKLGFRVEPSVLLIEHKNESSIAFSPYGLYLTTLLEPTQWLALELRPGIFLAGEEYIGLEIGGFARFRVLPTKFSLLVGINNHSNKGSGHNSGGSYEKDILFTCLGVGFQKDSKLGIDLTYYWTSNKDFAYTFERFEFTYSRRVNKKMNGIIKVGFSLAWDIL